MSEEKGAEMVTVTEEMVERAAKFDWERDRKATEENATRRQHKNLRWWDEAWSGEQDECRDDVRDLLRAALDAPSGSPEMVAAEVPQAWVDAAMDAAAGEHLVDGEEFRGDDLDFNAAVAAIAPLIRKEVLAEVREALRSERFIQPAAYSVRQAGKAATIYGATKVALANAADNLATLDTSEQSTDEGSGAPLVDDALSDLRAEILKVIDHFARWLADEAHEEEAERQRFIRHELEGASTYAEMARAGKLMALGRQVVIQQVHGWLTLHLLPKLDAAIPLEGAPLVEGEESTDAAMSGAELIAAERRRQVEEEGFTAEHDDNHGYQRLRVKDGADLVMAAVCYANPRQWVSTGKAVAPPEWPWHRDWWNPAISSGGPESMGKVTNEDRIRNLTKAGALLAAEIDRLRRRPDDRPADKEEKADA